MSGAGVTRLGVMNALSRSGLNAIEERAFTVKEALGAREAFITSASGGVLPVVSIDAQRIGEGRPGDVTLRVHSLYAELSQAEAKP